MSYGQYILLPYPVYVIATLLTQPLGIYLRQVRNRNLQYCLHFSEADRGLNLEVSPCQQQMNAQVRNIKYMTEIELTS